jgi:hypothetical protein
VVVAGTGGAVVIEGQVEARGVAAGQRGGTVEVVADRVLAAAGAHIDASGTAGGGEIAFGQTRQGSAMPRRAQRTGVAPGAALRADATVLGQGGRIVLNSTDTTLMGGAISARGGPRGGDGGFVEVSGARGFRVTGSIDVAAPAGQQGQVLFDPDVLHIREGADDSAISAAIVDDTLAFDEGPADAVITPNQIERVIGALLLQATTLISVETDIAKITGGLGLQTGPAGTIALHAPFGTTGISDLSMDAGTGGIIQDAGARIFARNVDLQSAGGMNLAGGVGAVDAVTIGAVGSIAVGAEISAPNVTLQSGASIDINAHVAATQRLSIGAVGDVTVDAPVDAASLRAVAGGNMVVNAPLTATVDPSSGTGGDMLLAASSDYTLADPFGAGLRDTPVGVPASLTLNGAVTADASLSLQAGRGGIVQTAPQPFVTPVRTQTLRVFTSDDVNLNGGPFSGDLPNQIATLGPSTVNGVLNLIAVTPGGGTDPLTLSGDIDVAILSLVVPTGVTQAVGSRIHAGASGTYFSAVVTDGSVLLTGDNAIGDLAAITVRDDIDVRSIGRTFIEGVVTRTGSSTGSIRVQVDGDLTITGPINAGAGTYALTATGDVTVAAQGGGAAVSIVSTNAGQVASVIGAGILNGNPIAGSTATLALAGNVSSSGALALASGIGGIVQTGGGVSAGRVLLVSGGDVLLDRGTNAIGSLAAADVPGALRIANGTTDLLVGEAISARTIEISTAGTLSVQAGTGGSLAAAQRIALRVDGLDLQAATAPGPLVSAPVVEIAPATPRPMQVALPAGGPQAPNALALTDVTLGRIAATDTLRLGATTIGGVTTTTATAMAIAGDLTFAGAATPEIGTLDLRSLGGIGQEAGSRLTADILTAQAGGAIILPDAAFTYLDDVIAGGGLSLRAPQIQLRGLIGAAGQIVDLQSGGVIASLGAGRIEAGELRMRAPAGPVSLTGANRIDRLGESTIAGDLALVDAGPQITIPAGAVVGIAGTGSVTAASGAVTVDGTVRAAALSLAAPAGTVSVNGFSAIATAGALALSGQVVTTSGLVAGAAGITVAAVQQASLAGIAQGPALTVTAPRIDFGGLDASGSAVVLALGNGQASGTLAAASLRIDDGQGARLAGSIAGDAVGSAAARGQRFANGVQLGDPPPGQFDFLFNDCPIGAAACAASVTPPFVPPEAPSRIFDILAYTVADNPAGVMGALDPAGQPPANPLVQIPVLPFTTQPGRDTAEDRELAPPNIGARDY